MARSPAPCAVRCAARCAVAVALAACGADEPPAAPTGAVRDSAGVRIVEHGTPVAAGAPRLADEPVYRYGDRPEGQYTFQRPSLGRLEPDGSAVIRDGGSGEIVRVAADGSGHSLLARSGQGPAEVRSVLGLEVLGPDTLLVEDDGNQRIVVFAGGEPIRSTSLAGDYSLTAALRTYGVTADGDLLMGTSAFRSDFEEPWFEGSLVRLDLATRVADTVARYDMAPSTPREGPVTPFLPFGEVAAAEGRFITTRADRPEIRWLSPDGSLEQVVRWEPELVYATDHDERRFEERMAAELRRVNPGRSEAQLEALVASQKERYRVDTERPLPFFGPPLADDEGNVWLPPYDRTRAWKEVPSYTVVAADGRWLGEVAMPPGFRILDVAHGRVLGISKDDLDVEHVVVYELHGPFPD